MSNDSLTPFKSAEMGGDKEFMALPSKAVDVVLDKFALRPKADDKLRPLHSIGIGQRSIVATDGVRAVCAGEVEDEYSTTDRRRAMLEADRESIYHDGFDANKLVPTSDEPDPENEPPEGPFPEIGPIIAKVDAMRLLAKLSPQALADVAKIALAAGADDMEILLGSHRIGNDSVPLLGFRFTYLNENPRFGEALAVPFSGLVLGMKTKKGEQDEDVLPDPHVEATAPDDVLWPRVVRFAVERGEVSTSSIQREFSLGFQRAALLLEKMEAAKVIGPREGPRPRKVLMTEEEAEAMLRGGSDE